MSDKEEVLWARLQGDWSMGWYRWDVASSGRCLETLQHDEFKMTADLAKQLLKERAEYNEIQQSRKEN